MFYSRKYTNKNDGKCLSILNIFSQTLNRYRQQEMQRQLEKLTDLVRLIVQKMEIPAEVEVDDTSLSDRNDVSIRMKKLRQTFSAVQRLQRLHSLPHQTLSHDLPSSSSNKI